MILLKSIIAKLVPVIAVIVIAGCANVTAFKMSKVSLGMSRKEAIKIMGKPFSSSAQDNFEYLYYALTETTEEANRGWTRPYYIRLLDGRVESFGRTTVFDGMMPPLIENGQTISENKQSQTSSLYAELKELKKLRDDDIINQQEFEALKKKVLEKYLVQVEK
jgi:hypothetical protein